MFCLLFSQAFNMWMLCIKLKLGLFVLKKTLFPYRLCLMIDLFACFDNHVFIIYKGREAVESWYSEIKDYNFSRPGFTSKTGESTVNILGWLDVCFSPCSDIGWFLQVTSHRWCGRTQRSWELDWPLTGTQLLWWVSTSQQETSAMLDILKEMSYRQVPNSTSNPPHLVSLICIHVQGNNTEYILYSYCIK